MTYRKYVSIEITIHKLQKRFSVTKTRKHEKELKFFMFLIFRVFVLSCFRDYFFRQTTHCNLYMQLTGMTFVIKIPFKRFIPVRLYRRTDPLHQVQIIIKIMERVQTIRQQFSGLI